MFPLSNIAAKKKIKLEISGFHIQITKEISDFIEKKIKKLNKCFNEVISVHVMLKVEKNRYKTEINISAKGSAIHGEQINRDLYISIDRAIDKVVRQSQKYKDKMKSRKRPKKIKEARELLESSFPETEPSEIKIFPELAKPMKVEEASAQLNSSPDNFLVFLNTETNQVNVIYKKKDGNSGLVQPK